MSNNVIHIYIYIYLCMGRKRERESDDRCLKDCWYIGFVSKWGTSNYGRWIMEIWTHGLLCAISSKKLVFPTLGSHRHCKPNLVPTCSVQFQISKTSSLNFRLLILVHIPVTSLSNPSNKNPLFSVSRCFQWPGRQRRSPGTWRWPRRNVPWTPAPKCGGPGPQSWSLVTCHLSRSQGRFLAIHVHLLSALW